MKKIIYLHMENLIDCPLFAGMSLDEIKNIIGQELGVRTFLSGQTIFQQGDEYSSLLIILEGEVSNAMTHISGKNMFIETLTAPNVIAPAILYAKNNKLPVNVIAMNKVRILPIAKVEFSYLLQHKPKLLMNFLEMISNRGSFLSNKVRTLCFGTIKSKIAGYLLEISQEKKSLQFDIKHSQQELADMFGVTRPALAKTIGDMIDEGLIISKQKNFTIINQRELARIFRESN
jgi:CRP/FNR family transcriptional regulator, dissimilatory nitrate respiration regulator